MVVCTPHPKKSWPMNENHWFWGEQSVLLWWCRLLNYLWGVQHCSLWSKQGGRRKCKWKKRQQDSGRKPSWQQLLDVEGSELQREGSSLRLTGSRTLYTGTLGAGDSLQWKGWQKPGHGSTNHNNAEIAVPSPGELDQMLRQETEKHFSDNRIRP